MMQYHSVHFREYPCSSDQYYKFKIKILGLETLTPRLSVVVPLNKEISPSVSVFTSLHENRQSLFSKLRRLHRAQRDLSRGIYSPDKAGHLTLTYILYMLGGGRETCKIITTVSKLRKKEKLKCDRPESLVAEWEGVKKSTF